MKKLMAITLTFMLTMLTACAKTEHKNPSLDNLNELAKESVESQKTEENEIIPFGGGNEFLIKNHNIFSQKPFWESSLNEILEDSQGYSLDRISKLEGYTLQTVKKYLSPEYELINLVLFHL